MEKYKTYKVIIPYSESAASSRKYKIEYTVEARNCSEAKVLAKKKFDDYSINNNASWIRTPDLSGIRIWRVYPDDPPTPQFIDELIQKLPCKDPEETISILKRLGELEDITASSKIITVMKTDNPKIIAASIITLGNIGDPTSFFVVKNTYSQKNNDEIRLAVVNTLYKLALPEDDILDFYRVAIHNIMTRDSVFKLETPDLIPLWIAEISNDNEFETVKNTILKLGEKALSVLTKLNIKHPEVFSQASKLVAKLKPIAIEKKWEDLPEALKKYNLL
ncbi:MAG: HEAT repeat domain-containing protein [Candidatus Riflebacteria bacterium]|nr:HEAT repeat domain-containing protein [Candidatus Riflebacteria bacterium]